MLMHHAAGAGGLLLGRLLRRDDDVVAAELADLVERLAAGALAHREHRDDAADAEDDAQHGQERPQRVQRQVLDAEPDLPDDRELVHQARLSGKPSTAAAAKLKTLNSNSKEEPCRVRRHTADALHLSFGI